MKERQWWTRRGQAHDGHRGQGAATITQGHRTAATACMGSLHATAVAAYMLSGSVRRWKAKNGCMEQAEEVGEG